MTDEQKEEHRLIDTAVHYEGKVQVLTRKLEKAEYKLSRAEYKLNKFRNKEG